MARTIRQIEDEARQEGERRARELVADAIQRVASDHVVGGGGVGGPAARARR